MLNKIKWLLGQFKPLKPYLRWLVLGATLVFIAGALHRHWYEVRTLQITSTGWNWLALSLLITLLAHIWTGWVWSWILRELGQPALGSWGTLVYLKTNVAKYLPGNIWHLYGRVIAAKQAGFPADAATLSVLLEPLLMAAAALILALLNANRNWALQSCCLLVVLAAIHPIVLNPLLEIASRLKGASQTPATQIRRYPLLPLIGEIGFVALRGIGFLCVIQALQPLMMTQISVAFSGFSLAWVMGLVIPGAPGGIGVVEAMSLALLNQAFPPSLILGSAALYRVVSILAELIGAGLAYLIDKKHSVA